MIYGELVTLDGNLFVKSHLDSHKDSPLKKVLRGYESFGGQYWFVTEEPDDENPGDAFGFYQGTYGWEWTYIYEESFLERGNGIWRIKDIDLPYAGKRGG
tara:strand:- start:1552 stop:1851 length:300 start_codon:yes stop_codon:yes gene_type:complete